VKRLATLATRLHTRTIIVSLILVGIAIFAFWLQNRDPFYASPKAIRDDMASIFLTTWQAYLHEKPDDVQLPNVAEMPAAMVLDYPKSKVVNLQTNPLVDPRTPPPITAVMADENGLASLPGGSKLRLEAIAISIPRSDDPLTPENDSEEALAFRTPAGKLLSAQELDALHVPVGGRSVSRAMRWFPMIRLVFRSENLEFHRVTQWRAFDERTQANVTQALGVVPAEDPALLILDTDLSIWHDTPVLISLQFPCGQPRIIPLDLRQSSDVALAPHARFQLVDAVDGKVFGALPKGRAFHLPIEQQGTVTTFVHRTFPQTWAEQTMLRVRRKPGVIDDTEQWLPADVASDLGLVSVEWPRDEIEDLSVVFLPHMARALFRLPSLPEMPNSRELGNLFDAKIPRLYLPGDANDRRSQDLAWIILNIVAGATETEMDHLTGTPVMDVPDDYWPKLFLDTSPRQLLAEYQRYARDPYVHVSRHDQQLRFHRPEPWMLKVEQWWYANGPDWLN
tara:strand:+ start:118 stop:1641 length:1524 start_codon:yes stop_codon:yes gene_type:complete